MKTTIIAFFGSVLIPLLVNAEILFRDTFEDYPPWTQWKMSVVGNAIWARRAEDAENDYASQAHGAYSLMLKDPDYNSYVNASSHFTNLSSEYMVEFYFWIHHDHALIGRFPVCVLLNASGDKTTDISLYLEAADGEYHIHVEGASYFDRNVAIISTTNWWYKIQIYRHGDVVDFYLDGELKGTYRPLHSGHITSGISFGSTSDDPTAVGAIFYDDVIVSTVPIGEHPRLLFDDNDLPELYSRKTGGRTYLGVDYRQLWESLTAFTQHFVTKHDSITWKQRGPRETLRSTFNFPYPQFDFIDRSDTIQFWLGPQRRIASELMALAFVSRVDESRLSERSHAESLLVSLSHWQMWNDPYFRGWEGRKYIQLGVGHLMYSIALAYDWLYHLLSNYERMSVQNTLINLGINQAYLESRHFGSWGDDPRKWPNGTALMMGGMGIACLALDGCNLTREVGVARARIDRLLNDNAICSTDGCYAEGVSYAGYAVDHLVMFCEADNSLRGYLTEGSFLRHYANWRIWCMLPGAERYYTYHYEMPTYWDVTFCDYDRRGAQWTTAIARLADLVNDYSARWYLSKRKDISYSENNGKCDRWDLYAPFGLFLWTDRYNDIEMPTPDILLETFMPAGWVITRTGWQDHDYVLALKSGQWFKNHNHHEQGSFIFGGAGRWLISDMGYVRRPVHQNALYHNVFHAPKSEPIYKSNHSLASGFIGDADKSFSYIRSVGDTVANSINLWQRSIIFFNELGSFAVRDYAEPSSSADRLSWLIHTWVEPGLTESDRRFTVSYPNGPCLSGYVVHPEFVEVKKERVDANISYIEKNSSENVYHYHRLSISADAGEDAAGIVVGLVPCSDLDSVKLVAIEGTRFKGVKLENERGKAAAVFSLDADTKRGTYQMVVIDSLFNVVANLKPGASYKLTLKKNNRHESIRNLKANDLGLLYFSIYGSGDWEVAIMRIL
jgi:hypothetical protein